MSYSTFSYVSGPGVYLYFTGITTCIYIYNIYIYIYIYTELAPKLTATASVAQSVERWSRDSGSRVRFPGGGGLARISLLVVWLFVF